MPKTQKGKKIKSAMMDYSRPDKGPTKGVAKKKRRLSQAMSNPAVGRTMMS